MTVRVGIFVFGVIAYLSFVAAILYLVGFVADLVVPKSINEPATGKGGLGGLAINLGLIALFGAQHSIMARTGFKERLVKWIPREAERSTFVLVTAAVFGILFWLWRPMPDTVWQIGFHPAAIAIWALYFVSWGICLASSFAIDHFDLFGLKQTWLAATGRERTRIPFTTKGLYGIVRHPINMGFLLVLWAAPHMTVGRLVFAVGMTIYIIVGTVFEERDLVARHGDVYHRYRERVPMLLPAPWRH